MKDKVQIDKEYIALLNEVKGKVRSAQIKASVRVNSELIIMYWELGKSINEMQSKTSWGDGLIKQLSKDLKAEFPRMKGFSESNLKFTRQWFEFFNTNKLISQQLVSQLQAIDFIQHNSTNEQTFVSKKLQQPVGQLEYEKGQQLVSQLSNEDEITINPHLVDEFEAKLLNYLTLVPWGHHIQIITKCKDVEIALFYILRTIENNWSRSVLVHQIESGLHKRQGNSINNFELTLPKPNSDLANEILKSPYSFEFLGISEKVKEKDLQNAFLDNISSFLMELGYGFAFLGKEKLITVDDNDFYVDLVFYHTTLHCYFIVELKIDDFKPEYSGKLNFYLNAFNGQIKSESDNPTIGLLLCKKANKLVAEYSLKSINNPIGVSEYSLTGHVPYELKNILPGTKEIENIINTNIK